MLAAGAAFLTAGETHHISGVGSAGECAYLCSVLGHGYDYEDENDCCTCN